jgi:hypothetical protein
VGGGDIRDDDDDDDDDEKKRRRTHDALGPREAIDRLVLAGHGRFRNLRGNDRRHHASSTAA